MRFVTKPPRLSQTVAPMTAPGRPTRRISSIADWLRGTKCSISSESTRSNEPSGNASAHASPTSNDTPRAA
jgi:hypothetical protein